MTQRNSSFRKTYLQMKRKEQLARSNKFVPVPKGSKPLEVQSRKHYRNTMKALSLGA